ncbi:fimbria/pilus outer membrane usher protein [Providencia sp. 21OH12SH02B-Prov]|uniref:fimbria/pilus outer membrane usher protein n=1 Tax=Providencia sp. 21OH12SH02B-Prov TaxID=3015951 RepID=UPI0022B71C43|nr:fimbria/pilus outer membrane usher protein [Providencia sp. 21OH12SH02B-Prov]WBA55826.1 fimbria/pilus outer membrane usher protein [Providencia sp. 21OH12SH02B-Prov]
MVSDNPTPSNRFHHHYLADISLLYVMFYPLFVIAQSDITSTTVEYVFNDTTPLSGTELYLEVTINQTHFGIARFGYDNDRLCTTTETLKQLRFKAIKTHAKTICLDELTGLSYHYAPNQQAVAIHSPLSLLELGSTTIELIPSEQVQAKSSSGALLNYDLRVVKNKTTALSSFSELRLFNQQGLFSTTQQTQNTFGHSEFSQPFIRLDTTWRSSFEDKKLFLNIGDTITRSLTWSRATRIAGLQIATDFSLQPYIPTAPLIAFYGSATLPSNVELYIDGIKRYSGEVPIGHFTLNSLPSVNGEGNAQIILTDSLGRANVQNISFYNDQTLLREGIFDWSTEFGVVRENYALRSFDYANSPIASTTLRYGMNNHFTASAHSELTTDLINLGIEGDWIPKMGGGTISTAVAVSSDLNSQGWLYYASYYWSNNHFNFGASATATTSKYQDIAATYSSPPYAFNGNTTIGYHFETLGNINLSYLGFRPQHDHAIRYLGVSWYKSLGDHLYLSASMNKKLNDDKESLFYLAATLLFENNKSIRMTSQHNKDGFLHQINANKSITNEGGLGWDITASKQGDESHHQIDIRYLTDKIDVSAGMNKINQMNSQYLGASGAIATIGNGLFISKSIMNSFAIVSTNGISHIPIKLENSIVGITDDDGLLLIPSLNSYQKNILALDSTDLPANIQVKQSSIQVIPKYHSGVLATFELLKTHSALVILSDAEGRLLPAGSLVQLNDQKENLITIGYDGMAYFDTLQESNTLFINYGKEQCSLTFHYPKTEELIPQIGPLRCHSE